jgi:hypothetical protein
MPLPKLSVEMWETQGMVRFLYTSPPTLLWYLLVNDLSSNQREKMKDRENYLHEVENRLMRMFRASRDGHKAAAEERHRLEGFMQAGAFLGLAAGDELKFLMNQVHVDVFGKTIQDRQTEQSTVQIPESIDYSKYEQPAYERGGH